MLAKTNVKTKKPKITKKAVIITVISAVLAIAIGIGSFLIVDYILVDTPYDSVYMPDHISVAKYIGATISRSEVQEEFDESKDALIDNFTKKIKLEKGNIEQGLNVTVSITAKTTAEIDEDSAKKISYTSYEIADIGNHEPAKDEAFFEALEKHILDNVDKFDFEDSFFENKTIFKYTYPSDYTVAKVAGKEVTHEIFITAVTRTDAPVYDDAFFVNNRDEIIAFLGISIEFTTVKQFEDYMREQIELNILWNSIVKNSKVKEYPEKFLKMYEDEFDAYYDAVMEQQGLTRAQLLSQMGTDESGYISARTEYAQGIVKEELILYEIIQAEKIRVNSKEYEKRAAALAKDGGYGDTAEEFEDAVGEEIAERTVIWEKVKEYLLSKAVWVD